MWACIPIIPILMKLRLEDCNFAVCLGHIVSFESHVLHGAFVNLKSFEIYHSKALK